MGAAMKDMSGAIRLNGKSRERPDFLQQAGEAFVRGDAYFRQVLDHLPAAVYITDSAGLITYYNEAAAALWGHRPPLGLSEWCGSWKLYWPDGRPLPHDQCPMALALREKCPIRGVEAIAERPDGTRVPFIPYPTPLYDPSGELIGAVNMLVEITEHKRAEHHAQRLAAVVEFSDDAILTKDLNGVITTWNRAAERIFGYTAEEAVGKSVTILIPHDRFDEEREILDQIRHDRHVDHYETVRQCKNGNLLDISLTISPIKDAEGKIVGASKIARDITERKRNEAKIHMLAHEVEHRAKNVLATVQATINLSQGDTPDGLKSVIEGRIQALANAHKLFEKSQWRGADLHSLLKQELSAYCQHGESRADISGPDIELATSTAQLIAVGLHELTTNAVKYGALSVPEGCVKVAWSRVTDGKLVLRWTETGGPAIKPPTRRGFGTSVIEKVIRAQLKGEIHFQWRPEGLVCDLVIPV